MEGPSGRSASRAHSRPLSDAGGARCHVPRPHDRPPPIPVPDGGGRGGFLAAARPLSAAWGRNAEARRDPGSGAHRYEWVRGWGPARGMKYGRRHGGVVVDAQTTRTSERWRRLDRRPPRAAGSCARSARSGGRTRRATARRHAAPPRRRPGVLDLVSLFRHESRRSTTGEQVWVNGFPEASGIYKSRKSRADRDHGPARRRRLRHHGYGANYIDRYRATGEDVSSGAGRARTPASP